MPRNSRDAYEVPLKRNIHWVLVILVLFFLGLLVDYLFLHLVFKDKPKFGAEAESAIESPIESQHLPTVATSPSLQATPSAVSPLAVKEFQQEIAKCFGSQSLLAKSTTTEQLVAKLLEDNPAQKSQLEVENTHLRLQDGTMRRLHLIPSDRSNSAGNRELRYFSLDAEGLPVLIPLAKKDRINPGPEFLALLQKDATVVFHQLKENKFLKDGSTLSLNTINDRVFEFQLFGKDKSFSCREMDCRCQ